MTKSFSFFVGLRYCFSSRRQGFVSFISIISLLGIALGVCVLITVLSVMNGFNDEIEKSIFMKAPHVLVLNNSFNIDKEQTLFQALPDDTVKNTAKYIMEHGIVKAGKQLKPVLLHGIDPINESKVSNASGAITELTSKSFNIIISKRLAFELGVTIGDSIILMPPSMQFGPLGPMPRSKKFTVVGFLSSDTGFGFENNYAMVNIQDAGLLYGYQDRITGYRLQLTSLYAAPKLAETLREQLPIDYEVIDWTMQYGQHLQAVKLEKMMMLLIMSLLIVVGVFNLVSSLVMIVNEKKSDIAILRTMGASSKQIMQIFCVQGTLIGLIGTLLGLTLGVLLAFNISSVVDLLLKLTDLDGLLTTIYRVDHFPATVMIADLLVVCSLSMGLSFIATLYPAWSAAKVNPAQVLRYE